MNTTIEETIDELGTIMKNTDNKKLNEDLHGIINSIYNNEDYMSVKGSINESDVEFKELRISLLHSLDGLGEEYSREESWSKSFTSLLSVYKTL